MRNSVILRGALAVVLAATMEYAARAAPEHPQPTTQPPVLRIVPGQGIGPHALRGGLDAILRAIGSDGMERMVVDMAEATRECDRRATGRVIRFQWRHEGLWLTADERSRAVRVLSAYGTLQHFVTDRGVHLGAPSKVIPRLYGSGFQRITCRVPQANGTAVILRYPDLGIQFTAVYGPTLASGRLFEIGVFVPGTF
jgi:hypothetical protein